MNNFRRYDTIILETNEKYSSQKNQNENEINLKEIDTLKGFEETFLDDEEEIEEE